MSCLEKAEARNPFTGKPFCLVSVFVDASVMLADQ
jgi:hypothetical protein